MTTPTPAVWSDGDPLMTAIAAAVWEQCATHPEEAVTCDDPRSIAAVAATVARQVLAPLAAGLPLVKGRCPACGAASLFLGVGGYPTCSRIDCPVPDAASTVLEQPASAPAAPADRATVLREAATAARIEGQRLAAEMSGDAGYGARAAAKVISCMADEAQPTETYPPAFPWAALMDTEDLAEFLAEIEHAIATPGATPAEALAAAETACSTWRLIAEAQHGHNTAPGPDTTEERREPHPTDADLAHALTLLHQLPATAATEEPQP